MAKITKNSYELKLLLSEIESKYSRKMIAPSDFEFLMYEISMKVGAIISCSTLKRLWGYIEAKTAPRVYTLDTLSALIGYKNWFDFVSKNQKQIDNAVEIVVKNAVEKDPNLNVDDKILLRWDEGKSCVLKYVGSNEFAIDIDTLYNFTKESIPELKIHITNHRGLNLEMKGLISLNTIIEILERI